MADTKLSALTAVTGVNIGETDEVYVNDGGTSKRATLAELRNALGLYTKRLASDLANSSTTAAKVTGLDLALPVGTFQFTYMIRYQAAAVTTGVKFDVNFSGTVTAFNWNQRWSDVSSTASSAVPDQDNIGAAGHVMGSFASRAKGTAGRGVTLSVDTANADMLMVIEGMAEVTAAGNLELYHGSEVAAASTVMLGSSVCVLRMI